MHHLHTTLKVTDSQPRESSQSRAVWPCEPHNTLHGKQLICDALKCASDFILYLMVSLHWGGFCPFPYLGQFCFSTQASSCNRNSSLHQKSVLVPVHRFVDVRSTSLTSHVRGGSSLTCCDLHACVCLHRHSQCCCCQGADGGCNYIMSISSQIIRWREQVPAARCECGWIWRLSNTMSKHCADVWTHTCVTCGHTHAWRVCVHAGCVAAQPCFNIPESSRGICVSPHSERAAGNSCPSPNDLLTYWHNIITDYIGLLAVAATLAVQGHTHTHTHTDTHRHTHVTAAQWGSRHTHMWGGGAVWSKKQLLCFCSGSTHLWFFEYSLIFTLRLLLTG